MTTLSDTEEFLQEVFGSDWRDKAFLCNSGDWRRKRLEDLDPNLDCYWCVGAIPWGKARKNENVCNVRALVIDDVGTKVPAAAVELALGRPTAIIETSLGNFQWVYRLVVAVAAADWAGVITWAEGLIGHKLDGKDAAHLFRVPVGVNTKPGRNGFHVKRSELNPGIELSGVVFNTGIKTTGPGPSGEGSDIKLGIDELREFMSWIRSSTVDRDVWVNIVGHGLRALCKDDEEGFTVFDEWSDTEKYPGYNRKTWKSFGAGGLQSRAGKLKGMAQAANPDGYKMFAPKVFPVDTPPSGPDGVEFFVDQERSSIEVIRHLAGRLKKVGRDDWREFSADTGRWREWTGDHMFRRVLELVNERKKRVLDPEVSKKLGSVKFIEGIARAAGLHESVIAKTTDFDRGALLLGVPSGVIDLKAGASRAVRKGLKSEMVSKAMWVDPAPLGTPHPEWSRFLHEFTKGDVSLEDWLQVRAGYCLTGLMDEYIMPFYHGSGGNGKSVYLNALRSVWGEYGTQMEHRLLFEKQGGYHLAPLAILAGVRLAIVTDVPQNAMWDTHIMKMLTGDDAITANRMHQNPITFKSTAKVDVSGNGEPSVKDMDEGIRRRLKLVPLTAVPKKIDKQLSRKLYDEYPAILRWALAGLDRYWALGGLPASTTVDDATRDYHDLLDPFQRWLDEVPVKDPTPGAKVFGSDLFGSWDAFRSGEGRFGMAPVNAKALIRKMRDKSFEFGTLDGRAVLRGYKLNKSDTASVF